MKANYFSVAVYLKNRAKPLKGIKQYGTDDYNTVYNIVLKEMRKTVELTDILKIDVWMLSEDSEQIKALMDGINNEEGTN